MITYLGGPIAPLLPVPQFIDHFLPICPNTLLRVCHRFAHDRIFNLLTDACLKICITGFDRHLYILSGSSTLQQYASL
ncbi:Uncharacterised protein [Shigella sonnei]|nr:Uncharacterised protein [Shigella sonnei]